MTEHRHIFFETEFGKYISIKEVCEKCNKTISSEGHFEKEGDSTNEQEEKQNGI